jgi:hypothetical protein
MNIHHPVAPRRHEVRVQYAHEAGKAHKLYPVLAKARLCLSREGAPVAMRDDCDGKAGRRGGRETRRFGPAADDEGDLGRVIVSRTRSNQRLQIGAPARDQHANP